MELKNFLLTLSPDEKEKFARRCNTTPQYMRLIAYKNKKAGDRMSVLIELESGGAVPISTINPDFAKVLSRAGYKKMPSHDPHHTS